MSSKQTRTRIMAEIKDMQKNPPDGITAAPLEQDLFEWHFTIKGADKTEFEGIFVFIFFFICLCLSIHIIIIVKVVDIMVNLYYLQIIR